jgi:hypothetical protein
VLSVAFGKSVLLLLAQSINIISQTTKRKTPTNHATTIKQIQTPASPTTAAPVASWELQPVTRIAAKINNAIIVPVRYRFLVLKATSLFICILLNYFYSINLIYESDKFVKKNPLINISLLIYYPVYIIFTLII